MTLLNYIIELMGRENEIAILYGDGKENCYYEQDGDLIIEQITLGCWDGKWYVYLEHKDGSTETLDFKDYGTKWVILEPIYDDRYSKKVFTGFYEEEFNNCYKHHKSR